MNPSISAAYLERERKRDPDTFRREFEAEPADSISTLFESESIEACVVPGRRELPPHPGFAYVAAIDAAFRGDAFTLGICHQEQERVVFDLLLGWEGSKRQPVNLEAVSAEIGRLGAEYRIIDVLGDQYCAQPVKEALARHGLRFQERAFTARFKAEIYQSLKHQINQGSIELLDHPKSLRELSNIELRLTSGGTAQIGAPEIGGYHDDYATVIALAASSIRQGRAPGDLGITLGRTEEPDREAPSVISSLETHNAMNVVEHAKGGCLRCQARVIELR